MDGIVCLLYLQYHGIVDIPVLEQYKHYIKPVTAVNTVTANPAKNDSIQHNTTVHALTQNHYFLGGIW